MFAVVDINGNQYKVNLNETIEIHKLEANPGEKIKFDNVVLLATSDKDAKIGQPFVEGASVEAKVVEHFKGDKIRIFKFKPKTRYSKTQGHRQDYTKIEILGING
ncbi:50S ribosomal protein L21 [Patescibacteria group bacterium]|nr:50S ribosomal protein L21 [Patescibacteria group bacterium]MBU1702941.1 50S ribosomal protein L21 [Patescibacteria group bacterium]MBU1953833.1 50S ribosomal protein L21 [Patescibacteria group bacterium]